MVQACIGSLLVLIAEVLLVWWFVGTEGFGLGPVGAPPVLRGGGIGVFLISLCTIAIGLYLVWRAYGIFFGLAVLVVCFALKDPLFVRIFRKDIQSAVLEMTEDPRYFEYLIQQKSAQALVASYLLKRFRGPGTRD